MSTIVIIKHTTLFAFLFSAIITILFAINNNFGARINYPKLIIPQTTLETTKGKPSIIVSTPKNTNTTQSTAPSVPWGTTEKIGDHLYRTYVSQDSKMGTSSEILDALNVYRKAHGVGTLNSDDKLCTFANIRAEEQQKMGTLDSHKGFKDYLESPDHWREFNMTGLGENASYGYVLSGVHLIEWVFNADDEHKNNQLNSEWQFACVGVSGVTVDIIFGKR